MRKRLLLCTYHGMQITLTITGESHPKLCLQQRRRHVRARHRPHHQPLLMHVRNLMILKIRQTGMVPTMCAVYRLDYTCQMVQ